MSNGRKSSLALTCVAILALAFAVSCRGFFVKPTLTSIAINPTAPQVDVGTTLQLTAFGTFDDGSRSQINSGVSWSSDNPADATVDPKSGMLTGVQSGTANITASSQGISGTAAATVLLTNVTQILVNPTSGTIHAGGSPVDFAFTATANGKSGIPLTTDKGGVLTITPTGVSDPPTCTVNGDQEECSGDTNVVAGTYSVTMTYPGSTASATATLTVLNP